MLKYFLFLLTLSDYVMSYHLNPLVCRIYFSPGMRKLDSGVLENKCMGAKYLKSLNLQSSAINQIHKGTFIGLDYLQKIYLQENNLRTVEPTLFAPLKSLEELYLMKNQLTYLHPNQFQGLVNLEILNLESNKLTFIESKWFQDLKNLISVNLMFNNINKIDSGFVFAFNQLNLRQFSFGNNPCSMKFNYNWKVMNSRIIRIESHNCKLNNDKVPSQNEKKIHIIENSTASKIITTVKTKLMTETTLSCVNKILDEDTKVETTEQNTQTNLVKEIYENTRLDKQTSTKNIKIEINTTMEKKEIDMDKLEPIKLKLTYNFSFSRSDSLEEKVDKLEMQLLNTSLVKSAIVALVFFAIYKMMDKFYHELVVKLVHRIRPSKPNESLEFSNRFD